MLTTRGDIKIGDFGLAAQLVKESYNSKEIKGTPKWMAPEILLTKPYNELVDIWSLGIILLELANGINPYRGMPLSKIMHAMKNEKPPKIKQRGIKWSDEMLDFVSNHCLIKNPVKRADATSLLKHPFMVDADNEEQKDAYLIFITEYYNCEKIQNNSHKYEVIGK